MKRIAADDPREVMIRLYTLGTFEIRDGDGESLPKPATLKSQSLLAFLICNRQTCHPRERLAGMFWGGRSDHRARRSLSTAVWHIRSCLPDADFICSDLGSIQFDPDAPVWLDAEAFAEYASRREFSDLQAASELYRGAFLDGFYDDWVLNERYRLENLYAEMLTRLMTGYESNASYGEALASAMQLLESDPLREDAHRVIMRAHCQLGRRNAALKQYDQCRQLLQDELGIEPAAETRALRQAIAAGRFAAVPSRAPGLPATPASRTQALGYSPLDVARETPMVGREDELAYLAAAWKGAMADQCSLVLISGEAGVGKTRLVQAFADQQRWRGVRVLQGCCYEFERLLPYQPFAELLRSSPQALVSVIADQLPLWAKSQLARLQPELRSPQIEAVDEGQPGLFQAIAQFMALLASHEPLLLVLEDLQWATDSALELLHYLARQMVADPLLVVGTLRPEAVSPDHPLATAGRRLDRERLAMRLQLPRLSEDAVRALITRMSGDGAVAEPLVTRLYQETEGNPFFLIETLKELFEQGAIRLENGLWQGDFGHLGRADLPFPATVSETIRARLARLSEEAQAAACVAAIVGRTFDYDLLLQAWGAGEEKSLTALDDLLRQRLIAEEEAEAGGDYLFTHHKIQETIYQDLPRPRRLYLHRRVGEAMEQQAGTDEQERVGELALHFERALPADGTGSGTLKEKAIAYLLKAGRYAVRQSAYREAISYFQRGLDVCASLPTGEQSSCLEVELQLALGAPTMAVHSIASAQSKAVHERAYQLCQQFGDPQLLFNAE
ncbi:MAG: AAA family ATPase, partial [Chloroflexota bacterium]